MEEEAQYFNENRNAFADHITSAGVDAHIILIGKGLGLCISPPLAAPACQSNPPQYVSIPAHVDSYQGLYWLMSHHKGGNPPYCPKWGYYCEAIPYGD